MKQKRILAMLLSSIMMMTTIVVGIPIYAETLTLPSFSGGTGTEADPFLLASATDLITLRDSVFAQTDDTLIDAADTCGLGCYHGYYFKLIKDIDMTGVQWKPFNFCGVFDGAGHTISNMQMNENSFTSLDPADDSLADEYESAFFSQVVHARIKNLYFDNCTSRISGNLDPGTSRDIYVAIVATTAIASSFENVSVTNSSVIQNGEEENQAYAAGIVGYADICHISFCSFDGSITTGGSAGDLQNVGGITGGISDDYYYYIDDYNMEVGAGKPFGVYNCASSATITSTNDNGSWAGGIVGMNSEISLDLGIKNCVFDGSIPTNSKVSAGIIGYGDEKDIVDNCIVNADKIHGKRSYAISFTSLTETITNCKISSDTEISIENTSESGESTGTLDMNGLTPTELTDEEKQVNGFKSNLHGKLNDGTSGISITLSQNDEVKYTAVTDADGEYNFGKQVLKGSYTLKSAETNVYKPYETDISIAYNENKELDITRQQKTVIPSVIILTAPIKNATPQTSIETDEYTATVVWSPEIAEGGSFANSTEYTATITITPKADYTTAGIAENGYILDGATSVTNEADSNIVTAVFPKTAGNSGGGGGVTRYTVKFDTNGGNTITSQRVRKNVTAVEPTKPTKDGYIFDGWYTDNKFTTEYDFDTKVTKNITLYAKWVEDEVEEPSNDNKDDNKNDEQKPTADDRKNPFTDVEEKDWFFDNVRFVNENGLMSGVSNTEFAPNLPLTRGMLVTILYRAEGEPAVNKSIPFADVNASQYYANAVIWAEQNSIISGINETEFAPDENITREQIATIIFRYAKFKGCDVTVGENTNILSYTDFDEISEYAIEAMQYAVGSGLMKGKTEITLNPKDNATRAEIAAILNRFVEGNK